MSAGATGFPGSGRRLARIAPPHLAREAQLAALAVVAFIAVTVWWLTQDDRVQDWDNGLHTMAAFTIRNEIAGGQCSAG